MNLVNANPVKEAAAPETFVAVLSSARSGDGGRMRARTFDDLDWNTLCSAIALACHTDDGAALARELGLLATPELAARRMGEVVELRDVMRTDEAPPLRGTRQIRALLQQVKKGAVLDGPSLLSIADTADAAVRVAEYTANRSERLQRLFEHTVDISDVSSLARTLRRSFDPAGVLLDSASPALGGLRRSVQRLKSEIRDRLDQIVKSPKFDHILQDDYVTIREERFVVPVRAGERGDFPGIVHGQSGSGATLFIEPQELIPLNNSLRLAQMAVENEERRILTQLSNSVAKHADELDRNHDILVYLDLTQACARFAIDIQLEPVSIGFDNPIALQEARHPVLALRETAGELRVIPNDIQVDSTARILVVSGPNTGGKTVTLKTVGASILLARAGLPVPAKAGGSLPFVDEIYTDIGDEQTVERDLSTFSSHVANIASFLDACGPDTLVLLDELFAGTDPTQGGQLGEALLATLAKRGAWTIVTTHLDRLKELALADDAFSCASVGFDVERLEPTYRLRLGVPGASYALQIASRIGLSAEVVDRATQLALGSDAAPREALMARIDAAVQRIEHQEAAVIAERSDNEKLKRRLENDLVRLRARDWDHHDQELADAKRTLAALQAEVKQTAKVVRRETKNAMVSDGTGSEGSVGLAALREHVRDVADRAGRIAAKGRKQAEVARGESVALEDLREGDAVYVRGYKRNGVIAEAPTDSTRIAIKLGAVRTTVTLEQLASPRGGSTTPTGVVVKGPRAPRQADNTLDLRGERVDEALERLDAYMDRASRSSMSAVCVVHGHGTGALKRAVREQLRGNPYNARYRAGERGEGGDGVTIIEFAELVPSDAAAT